jgi:hypothetical protein
MSDIFILVGDSILYKENCSWDVTQCSVVDLYRRFGSFASIFRLFFDGEDEGSRFFRNTGKDLPEYTASHRVM